MDRAVSGDEVVLQALCIFGVEVSALAHVWKDTAPVFGIDFSWRNTFVTRLAVLHVNFASFLQICERNFEIYCHALVRHWDVIPTCMARGDKQAEENQVAEASHATEFTKIWQCVDGYLEKLWLARQIRFFGQHGFIGEIGWRDGSSLWVRCRF
jgi:hypothetical protein